MLWGTSWLVVPDSNLCLFLSLTVTRLLVVPQLHEDQRGMRKSGRRLGWSSFSEPRGRRRLRLLKRDAGWQWMEYCSVKVRAQRHPSHFSIKTKFNSYRSLSNLLLSGRLSLAIAGCLASKMVCAVNRNDDYRYCLNGQRRS
jgi:hypothetical protein